MPPSTMSLGQSTPYGPPRYREMEAFYSGSLRHGSNFASSALSLDVCFDSFQPRPSLFRLAETNGDEVVNAYSMDAASTSESTFCRVLRPSSPCRKWAEKQDAAFCNPVKT
jgi:hypothetical protein